MVYWISSFDLTLRKGLFALIDWPDITLSEAILNVLISANISFGRFDYLNIKNNNGDVRVYCGELTGKTVYIDGSYVFLTFHSDYLGQRRGFWIAFTAILSSKCVFQSWTAIWWIKQFLVLLYGSLENCRKVASQVACGSCFQTIHTSQPQMKTILWGNWICILKASRTIHI